MTDLFGNEDLTPENVNKKTNNKAIIAYAKLIQIHGNTEGRKCKDCDHLLVKSYGNRYFKCELFSQSSSQSTDWRANWNACGKFIETETKNQ